MRIELRLGHRLVLILGLIIDLRLRIGLHFPFITWMKISLVNLPGRRREGWIRLGELVVAPTTNEQCS